jgi:hypothetical protein
MLFLLAPPASAGEPVLTLAVTNQLQASVVPAAHGQTNLLAGSADSIFSVKLDHPETSPSSEAIKQAVLTQARLENLSGNLPDEPLQKKASAANPSDAAFKITAGYQQLWDEKSMLTKISAGHQEMGCAYVSANFSF